MRSEVVPRNERGLRQSWTSPDRAAMIIEWLYAALISIDQHVQLLHQRFRGKNKPYHRHLCSIKGEEQVPLIFRKQRIESLAL